MKRFLRPLLVATLLLLVPIAAGATPPDALEKLVRRADMVFRGSTSAAVFEMQIKTKSYERSYKMVAWDDSRDGDRSLIRILGPAGWRGHATLKIGNRLKLYNPKTNHVQVIGHSMLGSSWMGSHFSNDDLVKETRLARDYHLALAKTWSAASPSGESATYYRVTMTPKPTAPVAWGRIVYELWEAGSAIAPSAAHYYRKGSDSAPARSMTFGDIGTLGGRVVPTTMTVRVASKPGEHTRITYKKLKLNIKIPASKFTEAAMRH